MIAWDVYNAQGNAIDTVWYSLTMSADEVKRDLIRTSCHYPENIQVRVNKY